ncbi:MAG TPA: hypothetical protein VM537_12450 [Anaerolineae bacterium]|jgi:hypothetical protein|nr:hypothetical protein [Anaerolineae bacterium]
MSADNEEKVLDGAAEGDKKIGEASNDEGTEHDSKLSVAGKKKTKKAKKHKKAKKKDKHSKKKSKGGDKKKGKKAKKHKNDEEVIDR